MSDGTKIEWSEASWNPIRAAGLEGPDGHSRRIGWHCEILTPGCENCYAAALNKRLGTGLQYLKTERQHARTFVDVVALQWPLRWRRPRRIFVCSMTDLFGEWVSDEMLDRVFAVMARCPQHTFQVLTKRAERMREYFSRPTLWEHRTVPRGQCVANLWLGVSVEDQRRADERIPLLLGTPAAVRWVSYEPALGPVDLEGYLCELECNAALDWAIIGGESGPHARPFNVEWARSVLAQCKAAGVKCFVKQLGAQPFAGVRPFGERLALRDRKGGDPAEWPQDLRVREYPEARA
jgi:protein gp37